jgi:hypothetical protein
MIWLGIAYLACMVVFLDEAARAPEWPETEF